MLDASGVGRIVAQQKDGGVDKGNGGQEQQEQPQPQVDIRARVAAFEQKADAAIPSLAAPRKVAPHTSVARGDAPTVNHATPVSASTSSTQIAPGSPSRLSVTTAQDIISRVNTTPRQREDLASSATTASSSPSFPSAPSLHGSTGSGTESPSEFGVLSPVSTRSIGSRLGVPASASSSSLPLTSSNARPLGTSPSGNALSPFSAAYKGAGWHTIGTSPSTHASPFETLAADMGRVKRAGSGTSLQDFTTSSIARARERGVASGMAAVSGKVPLPQSGLLPGASMPNGSSSSLGVLSPSDSSSAGGASAGGRASPAVTSRSASGSHAELHKRSSGSLSNIKDFSFSYAPAFSLARQRSTTESPYPSPSVRSTNPLDDDENEAVRQGGQGGYSLLLHPTLRPTSSPSSSRPGSRASLSRSTPTSPQNGYDGEPDLLSVPHRVRVGVQPPTPSPEKLPGDGGVASYRIPPARQNVSRRNLSADSTSSVPEPRDSSPSSPSQARRSSAKGCVPSLPPRNAATPDSMATSLAYTPYKLRAGSGSGTGLTLSSANPASVGVASKVPPPPSAAIVPGQPPAIPPRPSTGPAASPRGYFGHSPSASVASSPDQSPNLSPAKTRSPRPAGGPGGLTPASTAGGLAPLQPPPTRTRLRSSSVGPLGESKASHPYDRQGPGDSDVTGGLGGGGPPGGRNLQGSPRYRTSHTSLHDSRRAGGGAASTAARFKPARSMPPKDDAARKRYESVWDREVQRLERSNEKKMSGGSREEASHGKDKTGLGSEARDPLRARIEAARQTAEGGGGVASLASRFESGSSIAKANTASSASPATAAVFSTMGGSSSSSSSRKASLHLSIVPPSAAARLPARRVAKIWRKSRLPEAVLSQIWIAALAWDRDCEAVLSPVRPESPQLGGGGGGSSIGHNGMSDHGGGGGIGAAAAAAGNGNDTGTIRAAASRSSMTFQPAPIIGPTKEAFVRALAAIDGELAYRLEGRRASQQQQQQQQPPPQQQYRLGQLNRRKAAAPGGATHVGSAASASLLSSSPSAASTAAAGTGNGAGVGHLHALGLYTAPAHSHSHSHAPASGTKALGSAPAAAGAAGVGANESVGAVGGVGTMARRRMPPMAPATGAGAAATHAAAVE